MSPHQSLVLGTSISEAIATSLSPKKPERIPPYGWTSRNFVEAMLILFDSKNYDHERMCSKMRAYPDLLLAEARSLRAEEYLNRFMERYNHRQTKNNIELRKH